MYLADNPAIEQNIVLVRALQSLPHREPPAAGMPPGRVQTDATDHRTLQS